MCYMVCVISVWRVTWLPALRMWLSKGTEDLIFLRTVKNNGIFVSFMLDSSWTLGLYIDLPAFSVAIALALTSAQDHIHYWLFELSTLVNIWIPCTWLSENILHRPYSAFDTLFPSFIIYSCLQVIAVILFEQCVWTCPLYASCT